MNLFLIASAALCLFGAGFHEIIGTPRIAIPIMNSNMATRVKTIGKIVWHSVTFALLFNTIALFYFAFNHPNPAACLLIAGYALSFAILFWYCCSKFLSNANYFPHPWFFSLIAALTLAGLTV